MAIGRYCKTCRKHVYASPICEDCGTVLIQSAGKAHAVIIRDWGNINAKYGEEYRGWHFGVDERVTCRKDITEAAARKNLKVMWNGV